MSKQIRTPLSPKGPFFLHIRKHDSCLWRNFDVNLSRLPSIGEEIYIEGQWEGYYKVKMVTHVVVEDADFKGEIYAEKMREGEEAMYALIADYIPK